MSHQVAIREEELKNRVAALYFGKYDCTRIFCTTNPLTAEVTFGTSRAFGPVAVTNKTLEVDLGHLLATNGEKAAMYFWDDANSNCVRDVEGDHIVPWSKGGKTVPENFQMLCRRDNALKGGK